MLEVGRARRRLKMLALRGAFRRHGRNFIFDPNGLYSFERIEVGDDVFIGPGASLTASRSRIVIGNKVMLGPNVTVLGGNHNIGEVGRFMFDVKEKRPGDDQPVVIEDDVWVGAGATILKGVRVGRGSVVAAGAVVTSTVPPYSVVGGLPARMIKMRFDRATIEEHERRLYPEAARLSRECLEDLFRGDSP